MALDHLIIPEVMVAQDTNPSFGGMLQGAISPSGRYLLCSGTATMWVLDRLDESYTDPVIPALLDSYNNVAIDDDGSIYGLIDGGGAAIIKIADFGAGAKTTLASVDVFSVTRSMGLFIMPDASKKLAWGHNAEVSPIGVYDIGTDTLSTVANSSPGSIIQTRQDSYGDVWAIGASDNIITFQRVIDGGAGTVAPNYNTCSLASGISLGTMEVYHSSAGWFVCCDRGNHLYLIDDTDFSILAHRDYATDGSGLNSSLFNQPPFLLGLNPGATSFWFPGPTSYANALYTDLHKINAADLTSLDTHDVTDWVIGDVLNGQDMIYSTNTKPALISRWYGEGTPVLRYFTEVDGGAGGDGGDGLTDESLRLRVWGYILDGHAMAVFRVGPASSIIYDLTTGQFAYWASPGRDNWRAHVGQNWIGMSQTTFAQDLGSDVVCGDDASNVLWILDPTYGRDDRSTTSSDPFNRTVTGFITIDGREVVDCGAVTLALSVGNPTQAGATITLETSDDMGQTWFDHGSNVIAADEFSAVVEWRALGLGRAPGRVFKFTDNGAATRISAADLR